MTTFPKYERYKDSGVEWLGVVPEHWESMRAKHIFRNVSEKGFPNEPLLSATQDQGVVPRDQREQRVVMPIGQLESFKLVRENDFVISLRSFQGGIEHCAYRGLVSPAYTVLRLQRDVNPRYLRHLLKATNFISELNIAVTGIRQGKNIDYNDFAESFLPVPPKIEQARIVAFLDQKTAEIDALIAKKQRQIELLDEQKAILINRAVTRGLNPNTKLKPSGIEWIGDIPEQWEVKKFRYCAKIRGGQVDPKKEPFKSAILIAPDHIESGTARILALVSAKEQGAESGKYQVQAGDLIYSKIRPNLRKACIAPVDCLCSADMYAVTTTEELLPNFLLGYMLSEGFTKAAVDAAMRVAMPKVNREALADFPVVLPPVDEQRLIFSWLEEFDVNRGKALNSIESQIDSLKTLRSTLIAHAVTGRVKV
jgi:type I restriction enzyme S subunit